MMHIIAPCIPCTQLKLSEMQNKIVLLQPRWSSLETPGTSSRAFPNSLNFVTSINKSQTKNSFVKRTCHKYAGTRWLLCFNSSGSRLTLIGSISSKNRDAGARLVARMLPRCGKNVYVTFSLDVSWRTNVRPQNWWTLWTACACTKIHVHVNVCIHVH